MSERNVRAIPPAVAASSVAKHGARRGGKKAVSRLQAYGQWVNAKADRGQETGQLWVRAFAEDGTPAEGAHIVFRVVAPDQTGTGFIAEGIPFPVPSTIATANNPEGVAQIEELLKLGPAPGHVVVRAEPLDDQFGKVYADFKIEIADQVPAAISVVEGGSQAFPAGHVYGVEVLVRVTDDLDRPVNFGRARIFVPEDDSSGSFVVVPPGVPGWYYGDCDDRGEIRFAVPLWVGEKAPGTFAVRVQRLGLGVFVDIPYIAVRSASGTSDPSSKIEES